MNSSNVWLVASVLESIVLDQNQRLCESLPTGGRIYPLHGAQEADNQVYSLQAEPWKISGDSQQSQREDLLILTSGGPPVKTMRLTPSDAQSVTPTSQHAHLLSCCLVTHL